jgi:hypothetical protein
MAESPESLLNVVNASGFLFQLRVKNEIKAVQSGYQGGWEVVAPEHRWVDPTLGTEGFIDLVAKSGVSRMVIECKRVQDGYWVFLIPDGKNQMGRARSLWTERRVQRQNLLDWDDFQVSPASPESSFCILRGQGEKDIPMLERLSSVLLRSTESLAEEELTLGPTPGTGAVCIYHPVIVTNAKLQICQFDPKDIDLSSGQLPANVSQFQEVPLVRFRKNLSTVNSSRKVPVDLTKANIEHERTVFIINATKPSNTLREWKVSGFDMHAQWPWLKARELENS